MDWKKSSEALVRRFTSLLPTHPDAEPRKMFGYQACFVKGNFWVGLHGDNVVVRLPDGLEAQFDAMASAAPFNPMGGRPMRGWFVVPPEVVADEEKLKGLLDQTFRAVQELPPKDTAARSGSVRTRSPTTRGASREGSRPAGAPAPARRAPNRKTPTEQTPAKGRAGRRGSISSTRAPKRPTRGG